jgi:hypothetical protein
MPNGCFGLVLRIVLSDGERETCGRYPEPTPETARTETCSVYGVLRAAPLPLALQKEKGHLSLTTRIRIGASVRLTRPNGHDRTDKRKYEVIKGNRNSRATRHLIGHR